MILVICPHCQQIIEIVQLNCRIFRCGVKKINGEQIPPHASKQECDGYIERKEIYGCAGPFIVEMNGDGYKAIPCDYI